MRQLKMDETNRYQRIRGISLIYGIILMAYVPSATHVLERTAHVHFTCLSWLLMWAA